MGISWNLNWILLDINDFMGFVHVTLLVMGFDADVLEKKSGYDGNQMGLAKNKGCNGHIMGIYRDLVRCSWGYTNIYNLVIWVRLQMRDSTFNKQAQGFLAMSGNGGTDPQSRPYCRKTNENAAVSSKTWCI